jgi:hypothetical protein
MIKNRDREANKTLRDEVSLVPSTAWSLLLSSSRLSDNKGWLWREETPTFTPILVWDYALIPRLRSGY